MGNYTQLTLKERQRIAVFIEMGWSKAQIAKKLNRHRSTIYRELSRNSLPQRYSAGLAQQAAHKRTQRHYLSKIHQQGTLRWYIITSLKKGWSPEQIAGRMRYQKLTFYACHETIYQFIYHSHDKTLFHCLHYKKPKRQKRYTRKKQPCRYGAMRLIDQRSQTIELRKHFGHWEGDTIQFKGHREKVVTTLVERKSRMLMMIKNATKHSQGVMRKIRQKFATLPKKCARRLPLIRAPSLPTIACLNNKPIVVFTTAIPILPGKKVAMKT